MTRLTIVACVLTLLGAPLLNAPIVHAQEKFAAPTEAQVQLYSKALDAIANNNFEEAIDLLKSSLALGELNIIYLNLGRAYFRNGQCNEAEKAFDKVASAPKVAEPSPDVIGQTLDEFRAELTQCPGTVVVTCKPASLTVSIDGSAPVACSESPFVVAPGEHTITGADGELRAEARVAVESRKPTSVVLDATPDEPPPLQLGLGIVLMNGVGRAVGRRPCPLGQEVRLGVEGAKPAHPDVGGHGGEVGVGVGPQVEGTALGQSGLDQQLVSLVEGGKFTHHQAALVHRSPFAVVVP
ncbi:MAG: tetratricopeptide repeat protein [Myxococcota bacterium]